MKTYECEKCSKMFKQKIDYTRHLNRKYPCDKYPWKSKNGFVNAMGKVVARRPTC